MQPNDLSGRVSRVLNAELDGEVFAFQPIAKFESLNADIGSHLPFTKVLIDLNCSKSSFRRFFRSLQSPPNQKNATEPNKGPNGGYKSHQLSPKGHSGLRLKIALGAAMFLSGCYLLVYTVHKGTALSVDTGLFYAILGIFNVQFGILLAAHSYFSLIGG